MTSKLFGALALAIVATGAHAADQDVMERLTQRIPVRMVNPRHTHSDFTDPLGRFMDSLAAGAVAEARTLQPAACVVWRTSRQTTAVSGRFQVWDTMIDLDEICPPA